MAQKLVWGSAEGPRLFTSKTGKKQVVGYKTIHDTGKVYPAHGSRERERATKRKAKSNGKEQVEPAGPSWCIRTEWKPSLA